MSLNDYAKECHQDNTSWWRCPKTGEKLTDVDYVQYVKATKLALVNSEVNEALEGERKNLMDDHLPHRPMAEVELADALIRIFDYAGAFGYDLDGAYQEKRAYNKQRSDHKVENRVKHNGKAF
jgi:hypothetical protein